MITFPSFFLFFPLFFILHKRTTFLFLSFFFFLFFPLFFLLHTHTLPLFFFLLLSSFAIYHFLQTQNVPALLLPLFFFCFPLFLSPFSLSISFLPLLKIYPYSFLFFPSFLFFSFTLLCSSFFPEHSTDS